MSIFDHVSLKTTRLADMQRFYEAALAPLGIEKKFFIDRPEGGVAGFGRERVELFIIGASGPMPTPLHLAFRARNREEVAVFHAGAVSAGGADNGAPGIRPNYHDAYYAAFVIDPDGNNVEAVFQGDQ
ncbi:Glyoxalase-like domain protein [Martelella mediterranea DSM 17316]|uniref:Glyoxalase-like domain protein n=1 Tax=Martelella mediterranea DSM 17316 TaxID=1122214 RepID=A0A1U9Z5P1_9HYPH|nr:Glyoxalase-like domain protein [Martelella mediterranea DSM 17316]